MMRIGELARQTGLAPSKIRFYEAEGLIGAVDRKANGYRQYSQRARQALELINLAQQAGFSLAEIRAFIPREGEAPHGHDRALAELRKKLAEVEALQVKLAETRAGLKLVITRIETTPPGRDCFENAEGVLKSFRGKALPA
ncbi:MAG TPA: MerR family transcriptional regulator [Rhizomicrobium sp.]|nr:MerR family transcriptional regulator [Rhizomicrobium sp.]